MGGIRSRYLVRGVRLTPVLAFHSDAVVGEHGTRVRRVVDATGPTAACCAAARASLRNERRGRLVIESVAVQADGQWQAVEPGRYPSQVGWDAERKAFTIED